jgi:uncharacterized protein YbjT (DUF2867 family)
MIVLVTGGTGFVGREVLRQLRIVGHRTRMLARNPESPATKEVALQFGAKIHPGDVLDAESLWSACEGADAVIHLVGIISEVGNQTFENVHERGTRNMIRIAKDARLKRFVHMSALGTRADAASRYHQSKWAAEEQVRRSGLAWTIFRPSIIYGPDDSLVSRLAKMIQHSPVVPVIGSGRTRFQPVPVKAVGSAFVKALTEPQAVGGTYDLCGEETLTFREMLKRIGEVTGRRRLIVPVPTGLAWIGATVLEWVFGGILRRAAPLSRDQLVMLGEDNLGNGQPANDLFGLKPTPFAEGIASNVIRGT